MGLGPGVSRCMGMMCIGTAPQVGCWLQGWQDEGARALWMDLFRLVAVSVASPSACKAWCFGAPAAARPDGRCVAWVCCIRDDGGDAMAATLGRSSGLFAASLHVRQHRRWPSSCAWAIAHHCFRTTRLGRLGWVDEWRRGISVCLVAPWLRPGRSRSLLLLERAVKRRPRGLLLHLPNPRNCK